MTYLQRLRMALFPVGEDYPVPPREHKVVIDRRDLRQLLDDHDAAVRRLAALENDYPWGRK